MASRSEDAEHQPYKGGMGAQDHQAQLEAWGIDDSNEEQVSKARAWIRHLMVVTYYAKAYLLPYAMNGVSGVLVFQTTPASTRYYNQNMQHVSSGGYSISHPSWLHLAVSFFPGMALFEFCRLGSSGGYLGAASEVLPDLFARHGITKALQSYGSISSAYEHSMLRQVFRDMGIPVWLEIVSGLSWKALYGIDVYLKVGHSLPLPLSVLVQPLPVITNIRIYL